MKKVLILGALMFLLSGCAGNIYYVDPVSEFDPVDDALKYMNLGNKPILTSGDFYYLDKWLGTIIPDDMYQRRPQSFGRITIPKETSPYILTGNFNDKIIKGFASCFTANIVCKAVDCPHRFSNSKGLYEIALVRTGSISLHPDYVMTPKWFTNLKSYVPKNEAISYSYVTGIEYFTLTIRYYHLMSSKEPYASGMVFSQDRAFIPTGELVEYQFVTLTTIPLTLLDNDK